jgi:tetrapyrrole methylase family protein / MazG family protein
MPPVSPQDLPQGGYARLVAVMQALRAADGCPWDREQSLRTLQPFLIEETHELLDAIDDLGPAADALAGADANTPAVVAAAGAAVRAHQEELGDVLLQVVFQAQIAAEFGWFDADGVARGIADKMVRRHPHVFGDENAADAEAVLKRWSELKRAEGKGPLDGIPRALPALLRAQKTGTKAAQVGFDWPSVDGALDKVSEELDELREAIAIGDPAAIEHELGDALFALTSVARHSGVDAENALRRTLDRFGTRFRRVSDGVATLAPELRTDPATLDALWREAKDVEAALAAAVEAAQAAAAEAATAAQGHDAPSRGEP